MSDLLRLLLACAIGGGSQEGAAPPAPPAPPQLRFAKPRLLTHSFGAEPRVPRVADLDGDGFGDLVAIDLEAGIVDVARSVRGGKFLGPVNAANGTGPLASATTRLRADGRVELVLERKEGGRKLVAFEKDSTWSVRDEAPPPDATVAASQPPGTSTPVPAPATDVAADPAYETTCAELAARWPSSLCVAGDVSGDHVDDLVLFRRDDAWRSARDVLVCVAYREGAADADGDGLDQATEERLHSDPLDSDTDHDGLLDGWEVKGEGALDLPALGASPTRKDCVVYVQRYSDTDGAGCAREVQRVVRTWAELPNPNPDGSTGIALHVVWLPPLPPGTPGRAWWDLGNEHLPRAARGLAHYMVIYRGGGGQAAELGDMGGCGDAALWACFLHEFGHQVGLTHAGGPLPGACPTYTSLMSYSYSYGFNDDGGQIHYSRGEMAGMVLNETRLVERVELPLERAGFLAKGPYRFKLEADGAATRVDWNRDGLFGDGLVRADIDDVYGVGTVRFGVGKTLFAPVLVDSGGRLLLFGVNREKRLYWRQIHDPQRFEAESPIDTVAPTGDPAAVAWSGGLLLLVPTEAGLAALAAPEPEGLAVAKPQLLPESQGLSVGATTFRGAPLLLLWKDATTPIAIVAPDGTGGFAAARPLGSLLSTIPPAAAEDPRSGELLLGVGARRGAAGAERDAWRLVRLRAEEDGSFAEVAQQPVGTEESGWYGNARPMLLIERGPTAPAEGRIHFIGKGFAGPPNFNQCTYEAITIGDASRDGGWRLRRYCDEWSTTRSPVAACFHGDDLVLAYRWFGNVHGDEDDDVHVLFGGYGISDADMRDFDDVTAIADLGLERSIPWRDPVAK